MEKNRILVVDDEEIIRQLLVRIFDEGQYHVEAAGDAEAALKRIKGDSFNLLIMDLKMPKIDGMDALKEIKNLNPYIEVIIITGYPTIELAVEAVKIGAFDFICKPFDLAEMKIAVTRCLEKQKFSINRVNLGELGTLFEISKTININTDIKSLLARILDSALEIVKARRGSILLLDENSGELTVRAARGLSEEVINNTRIPLGEGIAGRVAKKGKPVLVSGREQVPGLRNSSRYETSSFLSIPLASKYLDSRENIVGVINITDKISQENFTEREQALISILAGQAAVAIENAKIYTQLQSKILTLGQTIGQLNQTQNQLIQSEKMAVMGTLSASVAHDINNPLMGIMLLLESLILEKEKGTKEQEILSQMEGGLKRIASIVSKLLEFSRKEELILEKMDINKVIDSSLPLIMHEFELNKILLIKNYGKDLPKVEIAVNEIQQVLTNILLNAKDASLNSGTKQVSITTYSENDMVKISIKDKGIGIKKEYLGKIFSSFFTTKPVGKGLGLGMSIAKNIMSQHYGKIEIYSEEQKGTEVIVSLPRPKY